MHIKLISNFIFKTVSVTISLTTAEADSTLAYYTLAHSTLADSQTSRVPSDSVPCSCDDCEFKCTCEP